MPFPEPSYFKGLSNGLKEMQGRHTTCTQQTPGITSITPVVRVTKRVEDEGAGPGKEEVFSGTRPRNTAGPRQSGGRKWMQMGGGGRREKAVLGSQPGSGLSRTFRAAFHHRVEACFKATGNLKASSPTCLRSAPGRRHLGGWVGDGPSPSGWGGFVSMGLGPLGSSALRFPRGKGCVFSKSQQDAQHRLGATCNAKRLVTASPGTIKALWAPLDVGHTTVSFRK